MRRSRTFTMLLSLLVASSVALAACGPKQTSPKGGDSTGDKPAATDKKPAVGGEITLRLEKEPDSFNSILYTTSYGSEVIQHIYATLFEFNDKWEPTPYVAESWKASEDNKTLTIAIKKGIKFTNGADLTAEDVVFTLGTIMHPDYKGPRRSSVSSIEKIEAKDPYTVVISMKEPFAAIFNNINYGIMQKKLFEGTAVKDMDKNEASMKPIGAGPYKLKEYVRGQYVVLERNPEWFMSQKYGGAPFIETVKYKIIPDNQTGLAALENGEIAWLRPDAAEVSRLEKDYKGKLNVFNFDRNGYGYMGFNVTRPHLENKLVRQALTYGLDRESIIVGVMDNRATVPPGPIPPVSWAFDSSLPKYDYNKAKAKQLLEQAGYKMGANSIYEKDGQPLKLTYYAGSGSSTVENIATIAKNNWKEIGVDLDVQLMDFNAMMDNFLKPGKYDISFSALSLSLDPDSQFGTFHGSLAKPDANGNVNSFNRMRFDNPKVNELLEKGRTEFDQAKRKQYYSEFQKVLADEAPIIPIYSNKYTDFVDAKVKGVVNYPGFGAYTAYLYKWYLNEK